MISIFRRRTPTKELEEAVEVGKGIESATEADVADGLVGLTQQLADVRYPQLQDVVREALTGSLLEIPAERCRGQPDMSRDVAHPQLFQIVLGHIVLDDSHPFGFVSSSHQLFVNFFGKDTEKLLFNASCASNRCQKS